MLRLTRFCLRVRKSETYCSNEVVDRITNRNQRYKRAYSSWNPNILKSPLPDVEIPQVSFSEFLWARNDRWPNEVALHLRFLTHPFHEKDNVMHPLAVCGVTGQQVTFNECHLQSHRFARALLNHMDLRPGKMLALILPNIIEFPPIVYGCQAAGIVPTLISYHSTPDEISYHLCLSEAEVVVTFPEKLPEVEQAVKKVKESGNGAKDIKIILTGNPTPGSAFVYFENLWKNETDQKCVPLSSEPDETVVLPYSSGTTGLPKGVCLTNRNLVANGIAMEATEIQMIANENKREVVPLILPLYHIYGLAILGLNIRMGSKTVLLPKLEQGTLLRSFEEQKASVLYSATPLLLYLLNNPAFGPTEMSSIQKIYNAASPLSASDMRRLAEKMKRPVIIGQAFGLTETSPLCAISRGGALDEEGSVGQVALNTQIKVMDLETKQAMGPNETGEICVKGPQVMKGYLKNEEETRASIDSKGWFHTGDLGYYNDKQLLFITGRIKELIKVKGLQVAPAEVEGVLHLHPNVASAGVVGKPDNFKGETPVAFVVVKNETEFNAEEIKEFLTGKLANYKIPSEIIPVKQMPVSNTGKILKRELKKLL